MDNYKKKLYKNYFGYVKILYGSYNLKTLKRQFTFYDFYYKKFLPSSKEIKILDMGCGVGGIVYWLQSLGYKNTYGIDMNEEQIKIGKEMGIKNLLYGDIREYLKNKKDEFDVIFAIDVLEHFRKEELLQLLELIYKSLKMSGRLIIKAPNAESPFAGRYRYWDFTHEICFTWSALTQILNLVGFKEVIFKPATPVPHGIKSIMRYLLWRFIEFLIKFYILVECGTWRGIFTQNIICCAIK